LSRAVRFRELSLTGFGLWRRTTRFRFPARLGVLVLPNESGKSTMVAGLRAVLFGLKDGPDAIRSWGGAQECRGRLELDAGDRRIRIARDFTSHETSAQEIDAQGRAGALLFEGTANPRGRTPEKDRYTASLGEILGDLADDDLFTSAFMITQSTLPGADLGESLRKLVSGVGRVGGQEALAALFEDAKRLTRATGDLRLVAPGKDQPRNQGTDGEIERTRAQIAEAMDLLAAATGEFHRQRELETREQEARDALAAAEEEIRHARADREQLDDYRESTKAAEVARAAYGELTATLAAADAAWAEADAADADAARSAADGSAAPSRWDRIAAGESGTDPVAWIVRARAVAARWREAVAHLRDLDGSRAQATRDRDRLSAIAVLPTEVQELLARLPESIDALERQAAMAEQSEESRRALVQEAARKRADFERRYAPIEGIDAERIIALLDERATLHRKIEAIDESTAAARALVEGAAGRRGWRRALLIGLPAGAAIGAGLIAWNAPPAAGVVAGVIVFAVLLLLLGRAPHALREARKVLAVAARDVDAARARLRMEVLPSGPWLPDDAGAADRAREIYRAREADAASLAETETSADGSALDRAARAREDAHAERLRLEEQAQAIEQATGLPAPDAIRSYRESSALLQRLEEESLAARAAVAGDADGDPFAAPISAIAESWKELVAAIPILGIEAPTLGDLDARLDALSPADWDAYEADARAYVTEREGRSLRASAARKRAAQLLETARGGPFADRAALSAAAEEQDERRRDAKSAIEKAIAASDLVREYAAADGSAQDRIRRRVEERAPAAETDFAGAQTAHAEAKARLSAWRPPQPVNLAALELRIAELEERAKRLERRKAATARAWFVLGEAIRDFASAHRENLEENLDRRFREITQREARRVRLGAQFEVGILEEATESNEDRLSQGARDQLAFCLRLAVADLVAGDVLLPLILDDPFVHSDAERLERIRESLAAAAEERQVILLTQDTRLAEWGAPIEIERGAAGGSSISVE
jgi:hypothetical protein